MDIGVILTTIHVPHVLKSYPGNRDVNAQYFIVGDVQSPDDEIRALCDGIDGAVYLSYDEQAKLGYACHEVIGPRCLQRRNIATLEAIKSGADVVLFIDDDNEPTEPATHLSRVAKWFEGEQDVWEVLRNHRWFNIGIYGHEDYYARGYPYSLRHAPPGCMPDYTMIGARVNVGVLTNPILGDPDVNATERLEIRPEVRHYDQVVDRGIALHPAHTWGPVNSQATAVRRELAPLAMCPPGLGRNDDIWGGYVAQRVMAASGYHVVYGPPYVRHDRNPHNLLRDLEMELHGMVHCDVFVEALEHAPVRAGRVIDGLASVGEWLESELTPDVWPGQAAEFVRAWCEDVAKVL